MTWDIMSIELGLYISINFADKVHRRIQDFVRGGGPGSAPDYLGEQFFVGRGGGARPPWPPPLDPRLRYAILDRIVCLA